MESELFEDTVNGRHLVLRSLDNPELGCDSMSAAGCEDLAPAGRDEASRALAPGVVQLSDKARGKQRARAISLAPVLTILESQGHSGRKDRPSSTDVSKMQNNGSLKRCRNAREEGGVGPLPNQNKRLRGAESQTRNGMRLRTHEGVRRIVEAVEVIEIGDSDVE